MLEWYKKRVSSQRSSDKCALPLSTVLAEDWSHRDPLGDLLKLQESVNHSHQLGLAFPVKNFFSQIKASSIGWDAQKLCRTYGCYKSQESLLMRDQDHHLNHHYYVLQIWRIVIIKVYASSCATLRETLFWTETLMLLSPSEVEKGLILWHQDEEPLAPSLRWSYSLFSG